MIIKLPSIVCGKIISCEERKTISISTETGDEVRIPVFSGSDVDTIIESRLKTGLHETHFDDITIAFSRLSAFVLSPNNPLRDQAVDYCSRITGYAPEVVLRDYVLLAQLYANRAELYDQLETELGNRWYIDEWVSTQTCIVHAQPIGMVLSILVGNIPAASAFGVLRGLVVKNNVVCKLPKRDPISALYYALFMNHVAPDTPIMNSISVGYWDRDSETEKRLFRVADAVCVWGGEKSIHDVRLKTFPGTKVLEYGPKRSIAVVDLDRIQPDDTLEDIALRIAHDFSVYNQEACFTAQELYVASMDESFGAFVKLLEKSLNYFLCVHPKGRAMDDNKAHVLLTRNEHLLLGETVISTDDHGWSIIILEKGTRVESHPLSRTIFIHRVASVQDACNYVNRYTQTVVVYPWDESEKLRESLSLHGADRICAIGMANYPRTGFPHDGMYTLHELVRWVSVERDIDFKGKYYGKSKKEFHEMLFVNHMIGHA